MAFWVRAANFSPEFGGDYCNLSVATTVVFSPKGVTVFFGSDAPIRIHPDDVQRAKDYVTGRKGSDLGT